jgi:hydrogenase nickel incorporation protein HypB
MCEVCGCGDPALAPNGTGLSIDVHASLLSDNDREASHLREHFSGRRLLALNLMGSPGSGKTALIEATARAAGARLRLAAVSGDLATTLDADRLTAAGVPSASITTGSACHLDAVMVHRALHDGPLAGALERSGVLFIENVGNLVCPAIYDLGQDANVVALSLTEGVDKPLKYPVMFRKADLVVLTKVDLLPYLPGVSVAALRDHLARVQPSPRVLEVSATTGAGIDDFVAWVEERLSRAEARA